MRFTGSSLLLVAAAVLVAVPAATQEQRKPLLSEEIRDTLREDGVEAAQRRFDEIFPAQADRYEIDLPGMMGLLGTLMGEDPEAGQAVMAMVTTLTQAQMQQHMPEAVAAAEARQRDRDRAAAAREGARAESLQSIEERLGPDREDVARFAGYYGEPDKQDRPVPRNIFVVQTCDGRLVTGASWGDASPWHLKTTGDITFTFADQFRSFTMEFEVDDEGKPRALRHDIEDLGLPPTLAYVGALEDARCFPVERGRSAPPAAAPRPAVR